MILAADIVRFLLSTGGMIMFFLALAVWVHRAGRASRTESRGLRLARRALLAYAMAMALFSIYGLEYLVSRLIIGRLQPFTA